MTTPRIPVILILLYALLIDFCPAKTLVNTAGEQRIEAINNAPLVLPNSTEVEDVSGRLNIIQELRELRTLVEVLQNETAQLRDAPADQGCAWEGIACHCHLDYETPLDAAILIGSNCVGGVLQWVRIIESRHADAIVVSCEIVLNTTQCDVMF